MSRTARLKWAGASFALAVLCLEPVALAAGPDLGSRLVDKLSWWLQTVVAPGLILVGVIVTAGAWISGGARQGMITGFGVIIAGVLCYSGPAVLAFIQAAAGG